jgi:hypothetical protein
VLYVTLVVALVGFALILPFFDQPRGQDHYLYLARSFVGGTLAVDNLPPDYRDFAPWDGRKYLPFGPLPAILLVPFLPLLDAGMPLVWVSYLFTGLNVWLFSRVLALAGIGGGRLPWALLLLFAGTPYFGVNLVGISTYFAHVVTVTFLLLAMWEMLGARRWPLVGLFLGLAGMVRFTAVFTLPFFLWLAYESHRRGAESAESAEGTQSQGDETQYAVRTTPAPSSFIRRLLPFAYIALGLALPIALLALYNYLRFGSVLESGYGLAQLYEPVLEEARRVGLFSLEHIPKNLQMMLLQGPVPVGDAVLQPPYLEPSGWGMSLFLTTPALFYIFRAPLRDRLVQACWLGVLGALLPILTYYGIGWVQFGYRYALDFIPLLVLLVAMGWRSPMTMLARISVLVSVVVCVWGSIFLAWWL